MDLLREAMEYNETIQDNQKVIRDRILESMKDIEAGEGTEYNEFFDGLEKRYKNA